MTTPGRYIARKAVRDLAGDDTSPAALARAGHRLEQMARAVTREHIRSAREAGDSWRVIGEALGFTAGQDDNTGWGPADKAYAYVMPPGASAFAWTCPACGRMVADHGPETSHPADAEHGHAGDCARLAEAVRAWEKQWEDDGGG